MKPETAGEREALLPCPFCGGTVELEQPAPTYDRYLGERNWWGVVCRNTMNRGGTCAIQQRPSASKEAAIDRWNMRAQAVALAPSMAPSDSQNAVAQFPPDYPNGPDRPAEPPFSFDAWADAVWLAMRELSMGDSAVYQMNAHTVREFCKASWIALSKAGGLSSDPRVAPLNAPPEPHGREWYAGYLAGKQAQFDELTEAQKASLLAAPYASNAIPRDHGDLTERSVEENIERLMVAVGEFLMDWTKGDFDLPELACCDARSMMAVMQDFKDHELDAWRAARGKSAAEALGSDKPEKSDSKE